MTKAEIVNRINQRTGIEKVAVSVAVETLMETIKDALSDGFFSTLWELHISYPCVLSGKWSERRFASSISTPCEVYTHQGLHYIKEAVCHKNTSESQRVISNVRQSGIAEMVNAENYSPKLCMESLFL